MRLYHTPTGILHSVLFPLQIPGNSPHPIVKNTLSFRETGFTPSKGNGMGFEDNSNIGLARPVENVQEWLPESNPPPFPDCSVVSHSSLVVTMPTSMTFEFAADDNNDEEGEFYEDEYDDQDGETSTGSACDDQFFLGKVWLFLSKFN